MIQDLLTDFGGVEQQELPGNPAIATLHELRTAIHQNLSFLSRHPTSLFQVIHNALSWRADDSQEKFFRASAAIQEPQGVPLPELQSLLLRWTRLKIEVTGPFPIAGSLRPPEHSAGVAQNQSIGSFDSTIRSLYFTESRSVLLAVASRDNGDAVQDRKQVSSAFGLFDPESGVELFPPLEIGSTVTASGLSPDAQMLVLGDSDGEVYVIDLMNREVTRTLDSGHGLVGTRKIRTRPVAESGGFNLRARRLPTAEDTQEYEQSRARDQTVQGTPWSAEFAEHYQRERQVILHVIWLRYGLRFGTLATDGILRIWSASTFQLEEKFDISRLPDNSGSVVDGVAVTCANTLYCCKGVHLCRFDLETFQLLQHVQLEERTGFPARNGFRLSHNEQHLVITGSNGVVTFWEVASLQMRWKFLDPLLRLFEAAAFSAKDDLIFVGSTKGGDIIVLESATGRIVAERNGVIGASITSMTVSDDGTLAIGAADGQIRMIAVELLIKVMQLKGHRSYINDLAIVPRSGRVLTASNDRTAMLWDIADLANPILLEGHTEGVGCVAVTREQDIAATAGSEGQVILWRIPDRQRISHRRSGTDIGLGAVAFSPNRTWIAACGNRYVWVWFLEGEEVYPFRTFHTEEDSVHEIVFDPSGEFLFALHSGHVIDGWRIRDGVRGHKDRLPWRDVEYTWRRAQSPPYEWQPEYRLFKVHQDVAIYRDTAIIGWWPGRGRRIEAVTPNRFVIWQGGSALEFVEIKEFRGE